MQEKLEKNIILGNFFSSLQIQRHYFPTGFEKDSQRRQFTNSNPKHLRVFHWVCTR